MRLSLPKLALTALAFLTAGPALAHENQCYECGDVLSGNRSLEVARMEQRMYRRFDHPARMRRLDAEIAYSEARIESLRRLQMQYRRVNRFGTGNALTMSAEQVRLELMREEMVLRDLRDQVLIENRYHRYAKQAHAAAVQRAAVQRASRVAVTTDDGEPTIVIVNH